MVKTEKLQNQKIGNKEYVNKNCWLVNNLGYPPSERCKYCELKFRNCLFFQYLIISLALIVFFLLLSVIIEGEIPKLFAIAIFSLAAAYGYFFNTSTEKIIKAHFEQKKAKQALEKLARELERKVEQRTRYLRKANEQLKELDAAKSEFISIASHQLRTPLTVIKGYISMMLEGNFGVLTEAEIESLKKVFLSNERLIRLVENLLNISRIESGRLQFDFREADLNEMVKSVIDELSETAKKKNLILRYNQPAKPLPKIKIDDEKIRQVVINLVDNGIKYTNNGKVDVSLKRREDKIRFCVSDSGMGIKQEDMVNLFKKFFRGMGTSLIHTEGTGLGLYVARKMIEAHGGKIWAESGGKNQGSEFYFELPINNAIINAEK